MPQYPDPFEGPQFVLSYELADNPGHEYEEEVEGLNDARRHMRNHPAHMIVWATLTNNLGMQVADKEHLL